MAWVRSAFNDISAGNFDLGSGGACSFADFIWMHEILATVVNRRFVFTYTMRCWKASTKQRVPSQDIVLDTAHGNISSSCTDGKTMWVTMGRSAFAYSLTTKARDSSKDIINIVVRTNGEIRGACSDGTTLWFIPQDLIEQPPVGSNVRTYFARAYNANDQTRDSGKDIMLGVGEGFPSSCTTDGTTMWILLSQSTLIIGGRPLFGGRWWLGGTGDSGVVVARNLSTGAIDGANSFFIEASRGLFGTRVFSSLVYANKTIYSQIISSTPNNIAAYRDVRTTRDATKDIALGAGDWGSGVVAGRNIWILDSNRIKAWDLMTRARKSEEDISLDIIGSSPSFDGLTTNGSIIWAIDREDGRALAFSAVTRMRINTEDKTDNTGADSARYFSYAQGHFFGIDGDEIVSWDRTGSRTQNRDFVDTSTDDFRGWRDSCTDGNTLWFLNVNTRYLRAWNISTGRRDTAKDIQLPAFRRGVGPYLSGCAIAGGHAYISSYSTPFVGNSAEYTILAYNLRTRQRVTSRDIMRQSIYSASALRHGVGTSDGNTLWFYQLSTFGGTQSLVSWDISTRARANRDINLTTTTEGSLDTILGLTFFESNILIFAFNASSEIRVNRAWRASDLVRNTGADIFLEDGPIFSGLWAGGNIFVLQNRLNYARAYDPETEAKDPANDIFLGQGDWRQGFTDGKTIWFVDRDSHIARAWDVNNLGSRRPWRDIRIATGAYAGAFTDGKCIWFVNNFTDRAIAYDIPINPYRLRIGEKRYDKLYIGKKEYNKIYQGEEQIWSKP